MSNLTQIQEDLKQAQLNKNELEVSVLRMLLSELSYLKIQKGQELEDSDVILAIQKEVKKRAEAKDAFEKAGRDESAKKEADESEVLKKYLPEQLSDDELNSLIDEAISQTGASGVSDMGKVIGQVINKASGKAEGSRISILVKQKLS